MAGALLYFLRAVLTGLGGVGGVGGGGGGADWTGSSGVTTHSAAGICKVQAGEEPVAERSRSPVPH